MKLKVRDDQHGVWFFVGALVVSLIVAALVFAISPVGGTVALAGVMGIAILAPRPKAMVAVTVLGITYSSTVETVAKAPAAGYLDEALILAAFVLLTGGRLGKGLNPRGIPGLGWFAAFLAFGIISGLLQDVPVLLLAQGAFLAAKAFMLAFAVAQVDWNARDFKKAARGIGYLIGFMIVCGAINLVIAQPWANIFQTSGYVDYRFAGLPSLIGPMRHPLDYGGLMALAVVVVGAYRKHIRKSVGSLFLYVGSAAGTLLSFRRVAISGLLAAIVTGGVGRRKAVNITLGVLSIPILIVMFGDDIQNIATKTYIDYLENPEESARTRMTFDSFAVGAAYFPFGAGFTRFGSYLAGVNYSPEYVARGYTNVYGLGRGENGLFLTDTQWPAIIGEAGILGAACFAVGLTLVIRRFWLQRLSDSREVRAVAAMGLGWMVIILVMSAAVPVFTASTFVGPVFALIGISAGLPAPARRRALPRRRPLMTTRRG